jgi:hypothetical protein
MINSKEKIGPMVSKVIDNIALELIKLYYYFFKSVILLFLIVELLWYKLKSVSIIKL